MIGAEIILAEVILGDVILGARPWLPLAIGLAALALVVLTWTYFRTHAPLWVRLLCGVLKAGGFVLLAVCLVEPLYTGTRPRPGSNLFLVLADNSRSLQLTNQGESTSRGAAMRAQLAKDSGWLTRLSQDFDVRRYAFDTSLRPIKEHEELTLDGEASALSGSLRSLAQRFRGQPVAGILLLSDGNATDLVEAAAIGTQWSELPPVYPVAVASDLETLDVAVSQVAVSQTNFEAAPVTLSAEIGVQAADASSLGNRELVIRVLDEEGKEIERRTLPAGSRGEQLAQRFLIKPEKPGISFYTVQASLAGEESLSADATGSMEATLANNRRLATVDRGGGPYRVLYVGGMPNWEFKFLRRALAKDDEVHLVGLVRIAKKEPKFTFLGRSGERTNPLFRGFGNDQDEAAEQYDEPVLLRLGTEDKEELRGGFPKDAEGLFRYHAVILDDVEAAFFTQDQLSLLQQFVSQRGGGLMMMGGKGSFVEGGYVRTALADMLPVYLDRSAPVASGGSFRLKLTREGWLQPWVRTRANEQDETQRLAGMPPFRTLNRIEAIKPGASVLAEVNSSDGADLPALAVQSFGRGRVGALLLGDLWRWQLRHADPQKSDLEKSWRQTVRWLVADVPKRVDVETRRSAEPGLSAVEIVVRARDEKFEALDNAGVAISIAAPDKRQIDLVAESSDEKAGEYRVTFAPRLAGAYRAKVVVTAPDGSEVGQRETGWAVEPATDEFQRLTGNGALLARIAKDSGGEVIEMDALDRFVSSLPNRRIPITENWTYPLWHQGSVLALAIACLVGEWGLRRWKGLP